jgi:short-subunit dehydrogenase
VFGLLNVTRAVLPTLRSQGSGRIINMGSSAGFAASAGRGLYGASKSAVEAITEALYAELAPLGIHATVVEPASSPRRVSRG